MSAYLDYLQGLVDLARQDATDPLARAIEARLRGLPADPAGPVAPPPNRDEPDPAAVLIHLYQRLDAPADAAGRRHLRRVLADLYRAAFRSAGLDYVDRLGGLIAFCAEGDEPDANATLAWELWGYLDSGLPEPLERLPALTGEDLERARRVLDLWAALVPPLAPVPKHHRDRIAALFSVWRRAFADGPSLPRWQVLLLLFRVLVKIAPECVVRGLGGVPQGSDTGLVAELVRTLGALQDPKTDVQGDPGYRRLWLSVCWEIGILLQVNTEWREKVRPSPASRLLTTSKNGLDISEKHLDLLTDSFDHLDLLDDDLRRALDRGRDIALGAAARGLVKKVRVTGPNSDSRAVH